MDRSRDRSEASYQLHFVSAETNTICKMMLTGMWAKADKIDGEPGWLVALASFYAVAFIGATFRLCRLVYLRHRDYDTILGRGNFAEWRHAFILGLLVLCYGLRTIQVLLWYGDPKHCNTIGAFPEAPLCWQCIYSLVAPVAAVSIFTAKNLVILWFGEMAVTMEETEVDSSSNGKYAAGGRRSLPSSVIASTSTAASTAMDPMIASHSGDDQHADSITASVARSRLSLKYRIRKLVVAFHGLLVASLIGESCYRAAHNSYDMNSWRATFAAAVWIAGACYVYVGIWVFRLSSHLQIDTETKRSTRIAVVATVGLCALSVWARGILLFSLYVSRSFFEDYHRGWERSDFLQLFAIEILPLVGILTFRRNALVSSFVRPCTTPTLPASALRKERTIPMQQNDYTSSDRSLAQDSYQTGYHAMS